ncbi:uncharacterized protein LOC143221348, partial [Lasioglossum baleicum]|uniref:uncharacterized protein LOC143221348 n=1 Tax=Lasioglossum baleicum TaxID=434251 RepID=UPI003FCC570D
MIVTNTISPSVKFGLQFAGIWPGTPFPYIHKICWVIVMIMFQTYQYGYIVSHFQSDTLVSIIDNLSICMPFSLVFIKLLATWINYDVFREILLTIEEDCQKYAAIDVRNLTLKTSQFSFYLTTTVLVSYMVACAFYISGTFAHQGENGTVSRELVFKMDLPFEVNESPNYELVLTTQILIHIFATFTFGIYSALLLMV